MLRTAMLLALVAFVGGYMIYAAATLDRRGDEAQIRSLVVDTVKAVEDRDLDGAIRCVSQEYKDEDGMTHDKLRMLVAQGLRSDSGFRAEAAVQSVNIHGASATVSLRAVVKSAKGLVNYDRNLILQLHKERARHAFVWPVDVWRVTTVHGLRIDFDWGGY